MIVRNWLVGFSILFALLWGVLLPTRLAEPTSQTFQSDASDYSRGAMNLIQKGMYSLDGETPTTEREPGYSGFLAVVYALFGIENRIAVYAAQALLYLLASLLFVREFRCVTSDRTALLCFGLLLTLPAALHAAFWPLRESVALSFFLLFAASLLRFKQTSSWTSAITAGLFLGAVILTYLSYLYLPLFLIPLLFLWRLPWKRFTVMLLVSVAVVSLWGLRNYQHRGTFTFSGDHRLTVAWYVRGEQSEHLRGLEPVKCLWAEYLTRDWTDRSHACSYNALMHAKWPGGVYDVAEDVVIDAEAKTKILSNLPTYIWNSIVEVLELHIPYVNGWGFVYNLLAALSTIILFLGVLLALPAVIREWRTHALLFLIMVYTTTVFALTDATPRYLVPVLFCYVCFASVGYNRMLRFFRG